MIIGRPVIVGMNNPLSVEPQYVLYPAPEGCAGWRLWRMLNEACGASRRQYVDGFERVNLLTGAWSIPRARSAAPDLRCHVAGRSVVLLGEDVWRAMGAPADVPKCGCTHVYWGAERTVVHRVPHPSGRNAWYNNPAHRMAVGALLARLLRESAQAAYETGPHEYAPGAPDGDCAVCGCKQDDPTHGGPA